MRRDSMLVWRDSVEQKLLEGGEGYRDPLLVEIIVDVAEVFAEIKGYFNFYAVESYALCRFCLEQDCLKCKLGSEEAETVYEKLPFEIEERDA